MLQETNSVIGGECLLPLFVWPNTDMTAGHVDYIDIFTSYFFPGDVIDYLKETEGAIASPGPIGFSEMDPNAYDTIDLYVSPLAYFRIIRAHGRHAEAPITGFYSTHLMNFVSAQGLCVAYPDSTLALLGALQTPTIGSGATLKGIFRVYSNDYFTFEKRCFSFPLCGLQRRTFTDPVCLRILFRSDEYFLTNPHISWSIGGRPCNNECIPSIRNVDFP